MDQDGITDLVELVIINRDAAGNIGYRTAYLGRQVVLAARHPERRTHFDADDHDVEAAWDRSRSPCRTGSTGIETVSPSSRNIAVASDEDGLNNGGCGTVTTRSGTALWPGRAVRRGWP